MISPVLILVLRLLLESQFSAPGTASVTYRLQNLIALQRNLVSAGIHPRLQAMVVETRSP